MKEMKDIKDMLKDGKSEQYIMEEYREEFLKRLDDAKRAIAAEFLKRLDDAKRAIAAEEKAEKEKKAKQEKQDKVRGELKEALCHYLAEKGNPSPSKAADMWIKEIDQMEATTNMFLKYFI